MPFCFECGSAVRDRDRFCRACGARQSDASPAFEPDQAPAAITAAPVASPPAPPGERSTGAAAGLPWERSTRPPSAPPDGPSAGEGASDGLNETELRGRIAGPHHLWAIAGIIAVAVASLGFTVATMYEIAVLERVNRGEQVSLATLERSDDVIAVAALLLVVAFVFAVVAFCFWIHRAYANLHTLGVQGTAYFPGWAVGYYFIPILNLFRPFQVMAEIWRASDRDHFQQGEAWKRRPLAPVVGWWWALWLFAGMVGTLGSGLVSVDQQNPEDWIAANWVSIAADVLVILAAVLAVILVHGIASRQRTCLEALLRRRSDAA